MQVPFLTRVGDCLLYTSASLVQNRNAVGIADGRNAMGNEDGRASAHDLAKVIEDFILGVRVDARQGIVEDENTDVYKRQL